MPTEMPAPDSAALARATIDSAVARLEWYKSLADRAIAQVRDALLSEPLAGDVNSINVIVKHMAGNMRSRFTEFLTSDGEKSWRNRDGEFMDEYPDRAAMLADWESGWSVVFATLRALQPGDLLRTVTVRGEAHTAIDAITRQVIHYGYHIGQIVLIARTHVGEANWKTLTIPRGGSAQYNTSMGYTAPPTV